MIYARLTALALATCWPGAPAIPPLIRKPPRGPSPSAKRYEKDERFEEAIARNSTK